MMVSTVRGALIFEERRSLIQILPDSLINFLDHWEVRVFIIMSIIIQMILLALGNRRKYVCKIWIRITLWCAYLFADWVAIVSLGIISKETIDKCKKQENKAEDPLKNQLMWFWAQFLLLHLGGPDTITAYSLEDNELWMRHLVAMVIQTALAFYVLLVAFPGGFSWLHVLSALIFVSGVIKYGERLAALYASHSENFRGSMLTEPDPGPNYAKFMEGYTLKKREGFFVEAAEVIEAPVPAEQAFPTDPKKLIPEAYEMLLKFKPLFADAILSFQDRDTSQFYFKKLEAHQAFAVVEVELGFMFDELYTKASIVYNARGLILRLITVCSTLFALMAFVFLCDWNNYKKLDVIITVLLLVVAFCLEMYAVWVLVNSDWTGVWLSKVEGISCSSRVMGWVQHKVRWSKKMAQHNLLDFCVEDRRGFRSCGVELIRSIFKIVGIDHHLEKHWYNTFVDVTPELQRTIFDELKSYMTDNYDPTSLWNRKGSFRIRNLDCDALDWINEREFDQRILIWHIATDICNEEDENLDHSSSKERVQISKHISNYMLYLLVACPFMLPIGIGMIRFRDTCTEAKEFLNERRVKKEKRKACEKLLQVNTEVPPIKVKGDRSKSVLFDACKLVKDLSGMTYQPRWELISQVWVEMLAHAATHCGGNHHARQLRKGGELLTHVWFLMAHLGITEQFQISHGHAKAKLSVS